MLEDVQDKGSLRKGLGAPVLQEQKALYCEKEQRAVMCFRKKVITENEWFGVDEPEVKRS